MCEVCRAAFITETIFWIFIISFFIFSGIEILFFVSLYLLVGIFMLVIEEVFTPTKFFYGPYFIFEVGIFILFYPLIFIIVPFTYFIGEEVATDCPCCGELVRHCLLKRGMRYGTCKKCGKDFVIKDRPNLSEYLYNEQMKRSKMNLISIDKKTGKVEDKQ